MRRHLLLLALLMTVMGPVAAQEGKETSCRGVLGDVSACCDKLEWLVASPNAPSAQSDCLPGSSTSSALECMLLATGKRLPFDTGLYSLCQNTAAPNVSAAHFLVSSVRQKTPPSFVLVVEGHADS